MKNLTFQIHCHCEQNEMKRSNLMFISSGIASFLAMTFNLNFSYARYFFVNIINKPASIMTEL